MLNPLVERFGKEKRWVTYRLIERDGKKTKVPYQTNGRKASSTDPLTWATHADLKGAKAGIIFTQDQLLLGVDIDHCIEHGKVAHELKDMIESFIEQADTYTEVSPSETGLHLFFSLSEAFAPKANKKAPFELYTKGRYFTVTNSSYHAKAKAVRTVTPIELEKILTTIGYPWASLPTVQLSPLSPALSPDSILVRMFASKNGRAIEALYNGNISTYKDDESSADMALCSHLAFWTGKNPQEMERLWFMSPLGQRKKTQDRKDYRTRTISAAIRLCTDIYELQPSKVEAADIDLMYTFGRAREKIYIQNTENIYRVLLKHPDFAGRLRFDDFKSTFEYKDGTWREFRDNDTIDIQTAISILFPYFAKVKKDMVFDAIIKVSYKNKVDSAADYMRSLVWDKIPRLNTWLCNTYGTPENSYHIAVGSNWLKGLVKRVVEPGCKFDYVLVLEGPQGVKKSTSLAVLGGEWHMETSMGIDNKDFFMQFSGKAIIELSEGESLSRTEVKRMKAVITTQKDKYRPPYARTSQDFPRRCVFAMTTNQEEYLKDETGNRRWLPIEVLLPEVNIGWLTENRDQLFAEAYERVIVRRETVHEFPVEEALIEQNKRKISYENESIIVDWYFSKLKEDDRKNGITIYQAFREAINQSFSGSMMSKYTEMRIADVFKSVLNLVKTQKMVNGIRTMRWYRLNDSVESPKEMTDEEKLSDEIYKKW